MTSDPRQFRGWSGGREALVQTAAEVLAGFGLPSARTGLEQMVQIGLAGSRGADGSYGYEQLLRLVVGRILREGGMEDPAIERLFAASGPAALEEMLLEPPADAAPQPPIPPRAFPDPRQELRAEPRIAAPRPTTTPADAGRPQQTGLSGDLDQRAALAAEIAQMRQALADLRARGARLAERHSAAEAELETLREAADTARAARDRAAAARDALEAEAEALNAALAEARAELALARDQLRDARAEAEALAPMQAELAALRAELEARRREAEAVRHEMQAIDAHRDKIARFVARAAEIRDRLQRDEAKPQTSLGRADPPST